MEEGSATCGVPSSRFGRAWCPLIHLGLVAHLHPPSHHPRINEQGMLSKRRRYSLSPVVWMSDSEPHHTRRPFYILARVRRVETNERTGRIVRSQNRDRWSSTVFFLFMWLFIFAGVGCWQHKPTTLMALVFTDLIVILSYMSSMVGTQGIDMAKRERPRHAG